MQPADSDDLVVSTPERVSFQYPVAGLGSRFLAQVIDMAVLVAIFVVLLSGANALGKTTRDQRLALLIVVMVSFVLLFGYFWALEAVWSGQTLGKRALRLRVVGDQGQPLRFSQAAIRNLVRIVDFLPVGYAIGVMAIFLNVRNKRLGDFAAGTLVVRERERVSLFDLASLPPPAPQLTAGAVPSIWGQPSSLQPSTRAGAAEPARPQVDAALRRLVVAYAARRNELPLFRRQAIADQAQVALRKALPDVVAAGGPLAALDQLAEREGITPKRPVHRRSTAAVAFGIAAFGFSLIPFFMPFEVVAFVCGIVAIVLAIQALSIVRSRPYEFQGEDRARTGRILGIAGMCISGFVLGIYLLSSAGIM